MGWLGVDERRRGVRKGVSVTLDEGLTAASPLMGGKGGQRHIGNN